MQTHYVAACDTCSKPLTLPTLYETARRIALQHRNSAGHVVSVYSARQWHALGRR